MEILNDKYKLTNLIKTSNLYSTYLAYDVANPVQCLEISISNDQILAEEEVYELHERYIVLKSILQDNVCRLIDFGIVSTVNCIKYNKLRCFFVSLQEQPFDLTALFEMKASEFKNYKSLSLLQANQKPIFDIPFIGHKRAIQRVMDAVQDMKNGYSPIRMILVHGQAGIGKSKFLKELSLKLRISGIDVFDNLDIIREEHIKNNSLLSYMLKKFIASSDSSLFEKYAYEFSGVIPEIDREKHAEGRDMLELIYNERPMHEIIIEFIAKAVKFKKAAIVFDDIHYESGILIDLISAYIEKGFYDKNLIGVVSYDEAEVQGDDAKLKYFTRLRQYSHVLDINLEELELEEKMEFVRGIMLGDCETDVAAAIGNSCASANPTCIIEHIRGLWLSQELLYDEELRRWRLKKGLSKEIKNTEDAVQRVFNVLNDSEKELLGILSFFNIYIPAVALEHLYDKKLLYDALNSLVEKAIVSIDIKNSQSLYRLENALMKRHIYDKLGKSSKALMHNIMAQELELLLREDWNKYIREYVYHRERGSNKDKAVACFTEYASYLVSVDNIDEAIKYLKRAAEQAVSDYKLAELQLKIANHYRDISDYNNALTHLKLAMNKAKRAGDNRLCVDISQEIAVIHLYKFSIKKVKQALSSAQKYLEKADYMLGYINNTAINGSLMYIQGDIVGAENSLLRIADFHPEGEKEIIVKARICQTLGIIKLRKSEFDSAKSNFEAALQYYEVVKRFNNYISTCTLMCRMSNLMGNVGQGLDWLLHASKKLKYVKDKRAICYLLIYLGFHYAQICDVKSSIRYYSKAMLIAQDIGEKSNIFTCTISMLALKLYSFEFGASYDYYKIAAEEYRNDSAKGALVYDYIIDSVQLHLYLGSYEEAKELLKKLNSENNLAKKASVEAFDLILDSAINKAMSKADIERLIVLLDNIEEYSGKPTIVITVCLMLCQGKYTSYKSSIKLLMEKLDEYKELIPADSIIYNLKAYLELADETSVQQLLQAYKKEKEKSFSLTNMLFEFRIAEQYYKNRNMEQAKFYYYEALFKLRGMLSELPKKYWLSFINHFSLQQSIRSIISIQEKSTEACEEINIKELEKLMSDQLLCRQISDKSLAEIIGKQLLAKKIGVLDDFSRSEEDSTETTQHALEHLCRQVAYKMLCEKVVIIKCDEANEIKLLAANKANIDVGRLQELLKLAEVYNKGLVISTLSNEFVKIRQGIRQYGITAAACIPIISCGYMDELQEDSKILGYLLLGAYNVYNNISENTTEAISEELAAISEGLSHKESINELSVNEGDSRKMGYSFKNSNYSEDVIHAYSVFEEIKSLTGIEAKQKRLLTAISDRLKPDFIMLFEVENGKELRELIALEADTIDPVVNRKLLNEAVTAGKDILTTDWELVGGFSRVANVPYWNSLIIRAIRHPGGLRYVIYVAINNRQREFKQVDLDYVRILTDIAMGAL